MSERRLFAIAACTLGIAFAAVTPPFKVPDEVSHFWRAEAMAGGHLIPRGGGRPDSAVIPQGLKTVVWAIQELHDYRTAYEVPLEPVKRPRVEFPAFYTPLSYVPQALASLICNTLDVRPLIAFYAGRLATLAAAIVLIVLALRIAPALGPILAAVALLPMSLFLFASWSADAITVALAILMTAMLLTDREMPAAAMIVTALALALCKPAYFLIPMMILVTSKSWPRIVSVIGASAAGTVVSWVWAELTYFPQRGGMPVNATEQLRCIAADPLRFARLELHDLAVNGTFYLEEMIGRLGLMNVKLPLAVILVEALLLLGAGLTVRIALSGVQRLVAAGIAVVTVFGVVLSQYVVWSIICGSDIEGVQGRYFLPVLPLALAAIGMPGIRWRIEVRHVVVVATICDVVAAAALWRAYW